MKKNILFFFILMSFYFHCDATIGSLPEANVGNVVINDGKVYAATDNGLGISKDNGQTWRLVTKKNGLNDNGIDNIAVNGNIIGIVGFKGFYVSTDDGIIFTDRTAGLTPNFNLNGDSGIYTIAISSNNIYIGSDAGLYISTDGNPFIKYNTDPSYKKNNTVSDIVVQNKIIYAATDEGVSISTNNGTSFTTYSKGLKLFYGQPVVLGIAVDGSSVYVTTFDGIGISRDDGHTFTLHPMKSLVGNIIINNSKIYVLTDSSFETSTDQGLTFTNHPLNIPGLEIYGIAVDGKNIYLATNDGLYISYDGGLTFGAHSG
jgi:hypothetical protein